MSEHLRDFIDPEAEPILEPEQDLAHRSLVRYGQTVLDKLGIETQSTSDGMQLIIDSGGHVAAMEVRDPDIVIPAMLRHGSNGLFYTYIGKEGESLWAPDPTFTVIPESIETGNAEADSLVVLAQALHSVTDRFRQIGRFGANLTAGIADKRDIREWSASTERTKEEIARHYNHRQDFYIGPNGFLDKYVQYSSGYLPPGHEFESLEQLQIHKIESLAKKLELDNAETVIEIGSGWGGLGVELARGAPNIDLTSLTVSDEQLKIAKQRAIEYGVADRAHFIGQDYRKHRPDKLYDRLVSVEMIEAVDWRDLDDYFDALVRFVNPRTGVIALQSINIESEQYALQRRSNGFASTAIFPGGSLVPRAEIEAKMAERGWSLSEATDLTRSYDLTIQQWRNGVYNNEYQLKQKWLSEDIPRHKIDNSFKGNYFYLGFSQAGFRAGTDHIQDWQLVFRPSTLPL